MYYYISGLIKFVHGLFTTFNKLENPSDVSTGHSKEFEIAMFDFYRVLSGKI